MTTLTDFLLARIAEDEAVARSAAGDQGATWAADRDDAYIYPNPPPGNAYIAVGPWGGGIGPSAPHMARHDPARVLAECGAKRRIVETARDYSPELEHGDNGEWALDVTLRLLATVYASHADYDETWRP